jgi:AraC-like DNA-binding protein
MSEDVLNSVPAVLLKLAHLLGTEVNNRRLEIPEKFGKGYCAGYVFNEHIRMLISNYELNEVIVIENPEVNVLGKMILFKFQNIIPGTEILSTSDKLNTAPSVLIATSRLNTDRVIPIQRNISAINIEVDANYLKGLFALSEKSPVLQSLLKNAEPLLFEQFIYPALQRIVDEILMEPVDEAFELFFLRIKAEELICRLLIELEKRNEKHIYALNIHDIQTIYKVKEKMLARPEIPPIIRELAVSANMSPSKMKRLFRQIFGNSIFRYYQEFRMKEAARLLKEENLSVTEAGYQLGFTNLSHFSRVFNEHIGMKPKQYSRTEHQGPVSYPKS